MSNSFLNHKFELACLAVWLIAQKRPGEKPLRSKAIAKSLGVCNRHLETDLQALVHAKVLRGVRGPKGGYELIGDPASTNLKKIYVGLYAHDEAPAEGPRLLDLDAINADFLARLAQVTIANARTDIQSKLGAAA